MFPTQNTLLGAAYRRLVAGLCGLLVALLASSLNPAGAQGQAHASASMAELEAKVKELGGQRFGGKRIAEIAEMTEKVQDELFDKLNEKDEYRARKVLGQYEHTLGLIKIAKLDAELDASKERVAKLNAELVAATNQLVANWEAVVRQDASARPPKGVLANVRDLLGLPHVPLEAKSRLRSTFGPYLEP